LLFFEFVKRRSRLWLDEHVDDLSAKNYDGHIELVRKKIASDISNSATALDQVYTAIRDEISPTQGALLAAQLEKLACEAHQKVGTAITTHGGAIAAARWKDCRPAALRITSDEPGPTRCKFNRGERTTKPDAITLRIGSHLKSATHPQKGALRTYFTMDFNFSHEYVSHSFACWDDQRHILAEGMLVWLAADMVDPTATDTLRKDFEKDTLEEREGAVGRTSRGVVL
jgi:hypothetical protein